MKRLNGNKVVLVFIAALMAILALLHDYEKIGTEC